MKNKRQEKILEIIASCPVETQDELIEKLHESGFPCTQATVSRDIKQLCLVKELIGGAYRYTALGNAEEIDSAGRLQRILHECCTSCACVQNLIVLKTMSGLASAAGAALDAASGPQMVGCVCGDDTVLIVMRTEQAARELQQKIDRICK